MVKKPAKPVHSPLGASSAKRWMTCPGSVRLSAGMDSPTSVYAAEGTVAHELAERSLTGKGNPKDFHQRFFVEAGHKIEVTQEMIDAVDVYLNHLRLDIMRLDPGFHMKVEQKFHLQDLHPDLYGTSDVAIYLPSTKTLYVRDYKHGQGVAVEAVGNQQLRYYALGALLETGYPAVTVNYGIVQPRCFHPDGPVRSEEISAIDLLDWSADLADAARATEDPDAPLVPNDECRWCPGAPKCPALQGQAVEAAKLEFSPALSYDPVQLADALALADRVEAWAKAVREFAYAEANHGRIPPGYKLVEKRATRKWINDEEAIAALKDYGFTDNDIFEKKLITPAAAEKASKDKGFNDSFSTVIVKQSSGSTLVPEDDKRAPVNTNPALDFEGK